MHIAIEGIDGVGKTTLARNLALKIGFKCVEKHLHALCDGEDVNNIPNYMHITEQVNASEYSTFRAWFYALGNLYLHEHYHGMDIVTDRYFASNYSWNGTPENEFIFDKLIEMLGKPEITFLIYASPKARMERLLKRNPTDPDLAHLSHFGHLLSINRHNKFFRSPEISTKGIKVSVLLLSALQRAV